ncbi:MAG TPA: HhH-GPD-type base excision DNA repair protein [Acidimicrobiales bacterium]|nr:HhH-GPD-type base excision DNA repair protein [Acidimicrobiales bacterium]
MTIHITGDAAADQLLSDDPFALLVAMVLDQQIPLERAFAAPLALRARLGGELDAAQIATMDPSVLGAAFAEKPALHRFPSAMAERVQLLSRVVVDRYAGDAARVWTSATDGRELLENVKALPGFGVQKAQIFVALLGKRLGISTPGWAEASGPFGEPGSFRSVADIDGAESLTRVREHKQAMKVAAKSLAAMDAPSKARVARRS